jgi:hypothetical protein
MVLDSENSIVRQADNRTCGATSTAKILENAE